MQGLDHRAECSSDLFSVSFSFTHVEDIPAPLGPPPLTPLTFLTRLKFILLFVLFSIW